MHTHSWSIAALLLHQISQKDSAFLLLWYIPAACLAKSLMQYNSRLVCFLLIGASSARPPGCCCCRPKAPEQEHRPALRAGCLPARSEWRARSWPVLWARSSSVHPASRESHSSACYLPGSCSICRMSPVETALSLGKAAKLVKDIAQHQPHPCASGESQAPFEAAQQ